MSNHTPGPWEFRQEDPWTIFADGKNIMGDETYYPWTPENIADWRLIAAAPELLDALKEMTLHYGMTDNARAAINKVKGQS